MVLLEQFNAFLWNGPLLILLFGTGLYLTFALRGFQFRYLGVAMREVFAADSKGSGDISHFQALMTSLAGAIGTGSIVGVTTAVTLGGFGALFWMWVTALFGMATKYAESLLAVRYRKQDARGEMIGGPMQYIEDGMGMRWMALLFAALGCFAAATTGNMVQVNAIVASASQTWALDPLMVAVALLAITALVIVGGVQSIGQVSTYLVPLMAALYIVGGLIILGIHFDKLPTALWHIIAAAFNGKAAAGGVAGATIATAIQMGVARSIFSNEAGLGISSIAAAAAKTDRPARQALVTMTGALFSTLIVCTITGLVLAVSGLVGQSGLDGAALAIEAFEEGMAGGRYVVTVGLVLFAYSTIVAWAYYGEKCFEYLFGEKYVTVWRILFVLLIVPGALLQLQSVWLLADCANALMVIPNLIALLALTKVVKQESDLFVAEHLNPAVQHA